MVEKFWRGQILDKRFNNIDAEIVIIRTGGYNNKDQWQKIVIYMIKYKDKWERMKTMKDSEVEMNLNSGAQ
jgi:hypothetical protein